MNLGQTIGILVLAISIYILWEIRHVLLLVFAAVVLATTINRLVRLLQRWGMRRLWAVLLSITLLIGFLVACFWLIVVPLAGEFKELAVLLPKGLRRLNIWVDQMRASVPAPLLSYLPDVDSIAEQIQPLVNELLGRSFVFVSNSLVVLLHVLLVIVLTLMLLFDPPAYRKTFVRLFPSFYRRRVDGILDRCEIALGGWFIGVLFNMTTIGIFSVIGLWALGIKLALAQGVLAGLLMFIPNLGPTVSVIPPMAIALLDGSYGAWKSVGVLALYVGSHVLESHVLTPLVMAKQVSLLPAGVLLGQLFFATVFGFLGLFLAIPLAVVGQIWVQEVLIKDVLDQWRSRTGRHTDPETVPDPYVDAVRTPEDLPPENLASRDRPDVDDPTLTRKQ